MFTIKRYSPALLKNENGEKIVIDSGCYYDTQFATIEECEQWSMEHGCNGYYDTIEDKFYYFNCFFS